MELVFQSHPIVEIATIRFINVPVILQFEETPLLEVSRSVRAGFTTRFPIYLNDGTKIAVVVGSRIHPTKAGKLVNIKMRHEANLSACEVNGKTILEIRREGAAALKTSAELYAPNGIFILANDSGVRGLLQSQGEGIEIGGFGIQRCEFRNLKIGIQITRKSIGLGVC